MLFKYQLYSMLAMLGFKRAKQHLETIKYDLGMQYFSQYVRRFKTSPTSPGINTTCPIFYPYLRVLLSKVADGHVELTESNHLLYSLFITTPTNKRKLLAHACLSLPEVHHNYMLNLVNLDYYFLPTNLQIELMQYWLKDTPEYSKVPVTYGSRKDQLLGCKAVKELLLILERNEERTSLTAYSLRLCATREEEVATAKDLLFKHFVVKLNYRRNDAGGDKCLTRVLWAIENERAELGLNYGGLL